MQCAQDLEVGGVQDCSYTAPDLLVRILDSPRGQTLPDIGQ